MPPLFTATDCLDPKGDLEAEVIWPGVSETQVLDRVQIYLDEGYVLAAAATDVDEAARQWAYYRAYMRKWRERSGLPSSVQTSDQGSGGFTQGQIDSWKDMADQALAEHQRLLTALPTVAVMTHQASESVRMTTIW